MPNFLQSDVLNIAIQVITAEVASINNLKKNLDKNLYFICKEIYNCKGKLVVIGVGKSGHIGNKISATFSSTGTPSFFMHPSEAMHGDLGAISKKDLILLLSYSGSSNEIISILPSLKKIGCKILSICGNSKSQIYEQSDISININVKKEACLLNLAPTSSTTVMLIIGDIIAIILMKIRNFSSENFSNNHPGGRLGKNLSLRIKDIMKKGNKIPVIKSEKKLKDALIEMTKKNLGCVIISNQNNNPIGFFTDGDLRRSIYKYFDIHKTSINEIMTKSFFSCKENDFAINILNVMRKNKINSMPVLNTKNKIIGVINIHLLIDSGIN